MAFVIVVARDGHAASAGASSEARLFSAADEHSEVIESIRDGAALAPLAEMYGAGGDKWFMVKSRVGNIGWIKASENAAARRVDDHFRALPKETFAIGPAVIASSSGPRHGEASEGGAVTIPFKLHSNSMLVAGEASPTAAARRRRNLVVDTVPANGAIEASRARPWSDGP